MKMRIGVVLLLTFTLHRSPASAQGADPPSAAPAPVVRTNDRPARADAQRDAAKPPGNSPAVTAHQQLQGTREVEPAATMTPEQQKLQEQETRLLVQQILLREQRQLLHQQRAFLQSRQPDSPPWLLPLLIIVAVSSVAAGTLPAVFFRLTGRRLQSLATVQTVHDATVTLESRLNLLAASLQKVQAEVREITDARGAAVEQQTSVYTGIAMIREDLAGLARILTETSTARPTANGDPVRLEHQVLAEHWKQFRDRKELGAAYDSATQENPWDNVLADLAAVVPAELRPTFEAVMTPYREHRTLVRKIEIIPRVVNGEMRLESEAAELKRTRDLTQLLTAVQSGDGASRLSFRFKSWVTDTFLPFADLYLQRYQQARFEKRGPELQEGMTLVRQLLRIASVEPIEVTLGETPFDSTRHVGRSTSSDPRFSDGVITGVVRNGFVEGGQQVIRQPEVIVNRVR